MKIKMNYVTSHPTTPTRNTFYYNKSNGVVTHTLFNGDTIPAFLGESVSPALDIETIIRASAYVEIVRNNQLMNEIIITHPIDSVFIVIDASTGGFSGSGALYVFSSSLGQVVSVAEYVALPNLILWDEVIGNPSSTPDDIDDAVSKAHKHPNKSTLDKWSEDLNGIPLFDGERVHPVWKTRTW